MSQPSMMTSDCPLLIEFAPGTRIHREPDYVSKLPIVQNGPPGTRVIFASGTKVSLPTDQIVLTDDAGGAAQVGFGGMSFEGLEDGFLVFYRVREIHPEELGRLAPRARRACVLGRAASQPPTFPFAE